MSYKLYSTSTILVWFDFIFHPDNSSPQFDTFLLQFWMQYDPFDRVSLHLPRQSLQVA